MFNDKTNKRKEKITTVLTCAAMVALAATLGYSAVANAQIQASVSKPVLRTEYKSSEMINLTGDVNLRNGDQKISISLRDSDLKPALRMIADKAGLNIIFHNSVSGMVTLDLVNVTLNDAFKMIMQACDLSFLVEDGTLVVMSKEAALKSDMSKQNMMTIPVKYADSAKIADFLNSNVFSTNRPGLSNSKIVVTNPVTNELVLFGTINDYKMAQKVISKLDVAPKTISYRVNHTTPKEMATLICQSLFPTAQSDSSGSSGGKSSDGGKTTGGASSSSDSDSGSDSSSNSGSSSSSSSSSTSESITLGEGKVACKVGGEVEQGGSLKSLGGSSLTVTYFQQKGTINVTGGSDYQAEMIKNFIVANDKKQPQAYIEVQVIDLNEAGSKEFSNTWNVMTPFLAASFAPGADGYTTSTVNPLYITGGPYTGVMDRYHGKKTLAWTINYLIQNEKAKLLANPKIVATNGKTSKIDLTTDYVEKVDISTNTQTTGNTYFPTVQKEYSIKSEDDGLGVSIQLTPFISPDGYVTLNLAPEYSTLAGTEMAVDSNGNQYTAATLLKRRNLEIFNVRIKDGETLVLGGMVQENEKKVVSKVPLLGDLPGIGSIFRSTRTENEKSELVIMVTPHIITDTEDSVANNENL